MAAGNTTVGSTPFSVLPILGEHDFSEELLQNTVGFKPLKLADQTRANFGSRLSPYKEPVRLDARFLDGRLLQ